MDKGYFDYDYQKPKERLMQKTYDETVKSDEQIRSMLGLFGWGEKKETPSNEEIQNAVLTKINSNGISTD